jgi:hypothetical protein
VPECLYLLIAVPKFYVVTVNELLCTLFGGFLCFGMELDAAFYVAVLANQKCPDSPASHFPTYEGVPDMKLESIRAVCPAPDIQTKTAPISWLGKPEGAASANFNLGH